jgi:hypothetical protein
VRHDLCHATGADDENVLFHFGGYLLLPVLLA